MATTTIVFTDASRSTESLVAAGDEAGTKEIADHLRATQRVVERFEGRVCKTLGDGVMALFTSARSGLRAALALQQENDRMARSGGPAVRLRVGVHVGDVVDMTLAGEPDVLGSAVVVARRLCDRADAGAIIVSEVVRLLVGDSCQTTFESLGQWRLKGLSDLTTVHEASWEPLALDAPLRVVVADDAPLVLAGLVRLLADEGFEVVAEVGDRDALVDAVRRHTPDLVVTDIRMPPTFVDEGLRAAALIRSEHPSVAVLVLSQHVEAAAAVALLKASPTSIGYLLKERVAAVDEFLDACRAVVDGATIIDPLVSDRTALLLENRTG